MRYLLLILTFSSLKAWSQPDDVAIKGTITNLFSGMRQSDTSLARSAFAPGAILQTVRVEKSGATRIISESIDSFIISISRPHKEIYDERISFETIKTDGNLASVWTPYRFFLGDKFSHCGVDSYQLVKIEGNWKIQYLIDTRRKENCESH
jgi:hypothetical protein